MKKPDLAQTIAEKINRLEEEIRKTPYHKGTEHHIGRMRAKIANLKNREEQIRKSSGHFGFIPKKEGDATIVLIGPPSVGKSTLLRNLTQAQSRVEEWPFTTLTVIPGMLDYQGAKIQIFDLPGIIKGASIGLGRGKEVISATRAADLLLLMVDIKSQNQIPNILKELKKSAVDLPVIIVINKADLMKDQEKLGKKEKGQDKIFISAEKEIGLEELKNIIWEKLGLMRIYLKPKDKQPNLQEPLILKKGQTIKDVIEKTFPPDKKITQILLWGPSARFPKQQVSKDHKLADEDILSFS